MLINYILFYVLNIMKGGIFIIIIILFLVKYTYSNILTSIDTTKSYSIGIIKNDEDISTISKLLASYASRENIHINIYSFENNKKLLEALNRNEVNFSIQNEDYVVDSILGLNMFENNPLKNLRFICGLFFNYYYFVTDIIYKDESKEIKIENVEDLRKFYDIYQRHFVIGTEEMSSVSFSNLIVLLYMYGFKPINITKKDENETYDSETIFYSTGSINETFRKFNQDLIDGIFIMRTNNNSYITQTSNEKDVIFLNITFNNTIFDKLFSLYFYKTRLQINENIDTVQDLVNQSSFETRMSRVLLITNKYMKENIGQKLCEIYFKHNNYIINRLTNNNENSEHKYFEPIDLIHINKNILYDEHTKKYLQDLGFLMINPTNDQLKRAEINDVDKYKYYWKYNKIGINRFKFE